jgi:hypothetical protein
MTYQSTVLSLSGLVAYWPLNEAAGTSTAKDLGPHGVPLSYSSGKSAGADLASGLGRSAALSGSNYLTATSAPRNTPFTENWSGYSYGLWVRPTAVPVGSVWLGGASGGWRMALTSGLNIQAPVYISGTSILGYPYGGSWPTTPDVLKEGTSYLVIVSWDGDEIVAWINGVKITTIRSIGGFVPATTDRFQIFQSGGSGAADVSGPFILNRGISASEARALYEAGTLTKPLAEAVSFDYENASLVSNAPEGSGCGACGGKMAAAEASVSVTTGIAYHPGCYGARQLSKAAPSGGVVAGTTPLESSGECTKLMWDMLTYFTRRPSAQHLAYLNPASDLYVGFSSPGVELSDDASDGYAMTQTGFAPMAAKLAWYGKAPASSWLVSLAQKIINGFLAAQPLIAGKTPQGLEQSMFFPVQLAETILYLQPYLSKSTYNSWVKALLVFMNDFYLAEYFPYYANGNFELQYLYLIWMTHKITGDSKWASQYAKQYNWVVDPASVQAPSGRNNALGRGLVITKNPSKADGSNGAGFITETTNNGTSITGISQTNPAIVTLSSSVQGLCPANGSTKNRVVISGVEGCTKANGVWTPTVRSSTTFSIPFDNASGHAYGGGGQIVPVGYDPSYSVLQLSVLSNLYFYSKDAKILRLLNLVFNQTMENVDKSTWIIDCTEGIRKSYYMRYATAAMQMLHWVGGRSDLAASDVAAQWNATHADIRSAMNGAETPGGRDTNYIVGGTLLTSSDWPGFPG